ncbi:FlgD immunoglobulin-like domain containing protein [candidate division KSB1 bacterium]
MYKEKIPVKKRDGRNPYTQFRAIPTMDFNTDIVNIKIHAVKMASVCGYSFELKYDKKHYEFIEAVSEVPFKKRGEQSLYINKIADNKILISEVLRNFSAKSALSGDAELATLRFKWIGDDAPEMTLDKFSVIDELLRVNKPPKISYHGDFQPKIERLIISPDRFHNETNIQLAIYESDFITLIIYDRSEKKIKSLRDNVKMRAGIRTVRWDGTDDNGNEVAPGTYTVKLIIGDKEFTVKVTKIR